ncbi:MAG: UDP-glucose 4-epimerase GalE [bacterium]|nr:UDP-glucose 4-epimerase GalE [bacterium]
MKKVLITGVGGYIGSVGASVFLDNGYSVVGIDNFSKGFRQPIEATRKKYGKDRYEFYECDLNDEKKLDDIFDKIGEFEAVIHFAAFCNVNESMENPGKYFTNNINGTLNILNSMHKHSIKSLVFSSTCATYGTPDVLPVTENLSTHPDSPYGESKLMVEKIIDWYGKLFGIKYCIMRYFNVCGATIDGSIGDSKKPSVHLIQNAVLGALGVRPFQLTCGSVETPDGTPIRDYVDIVDLVEAHLAAVEYLGQDGESNIFNIGTGEGNSVLEIVETVKKYTGVSFEIEKGQSRMGESAMVYANPEKANKILKWKSKRNIEDSVKSLIIWYKSRPNGWEF